jgi:single-strand DNA-binding protein
MSFNKIIVVGNLGRDPELRYTPQGNAVCDFSVATNEKKRDKAGEMQDVTTWFKVTLWGKQAENASKYLTKGSPVYVEGRLRVEEWTDRDGKTRQSLEVNATDMQFLSRGEGMSSHSSSPENDYSDSNSFSDSSSSGGASKGSSSSTPTDDDIPF